MWLAVKDWLPLGATLAAAVAAIVALANYRHQTRTKKAEFMLALHKSFFVEEFYKEIRERIDDDSTGKVDALVTGQSADFTDFLNFFELIAYMGKQGVLSDRDIEALLGYYLQILRRNKSIRAYIGEPGNGFEHLKDLIEGRVE